MIGTQRPSKMNPDALQNDPCMTQDEDTRYVCIGPVNKTINMLACWFEDPDGDAFKRCGAAHIAHASRKVLPCAICGIHDGICIQKPLARSLVVVVN